MAGGALVPVEVAPGVVVQVPDYIAAQRQSGAAPMVMPPRPPGDPNRVAGPGGGNPFLEQMSPDYAAVVNQPKLAPPSPLSMTVTPPTEDAETRFKRDQANRANEAARDTYANRKNPANLKPVPKPDPRAESNVIATSAMDFYGKPQGGGPARPTTVDPNNLRPVVAELKQERVPGQALLPEQKWRMGLEARPKELYELDRNVQQPTWGTEDPVMREKLTPLEKGAKASGESAEREYLRQVDEAKLAGVQQRSLLAQQSDDLDNQLHTIATRRDKIASLQAEADKRMQEANSFEPRTRAQVWDGVGPLGQALSVLSMAIGQYSATLSHTGVNPGWNMVQKFVEGSVDDDRAKWDRLRQGGLDARSNLNQAITLYGDLDTALLDSKARKYANVAAMANQMMNSRELDATAKERAAGIKSMAEEQYLASFQQIADRITGKVIKEEATLRPYGEVVQKATPKPTGGGGGPIGISGDKLRGMSAEVRSLAIKLPDGTFKFVRSPQARIEMQERMNGARDMIASLRQLQQLRADKTNTIPWTKKRGQIEAINANLITLGKSKNQMGALDKGLIEFSGKQYGSPEQFNLVDDSIDGKIEQNIKLLTDEVRRVSERDLDDGPFELTQGGVTPDEVTQ